MLYTLNKLEQKTTNNFKINDISLELTIPETISSKSFNVQGTEIDKITIEFKKKRRKLTSKLGLDFNEYLDCNIIVPKNTVVREPIYLEYEFEKSDALISNFNIKYEANSSASFVIKFSSKDKNSYFNFFKENLINEESSNGNITILNFLNNSSYNFFAIENDAFENAKVNHTIIDIGAKIKIGNIYSNTVGENATNGVNNIYLGMDEDIIDMNYTLKNKFKKTVNILKVDGALSDKAKKNFRGIIDILKGATNAVGKEKENCILLSDTCVARSLPMLLCQEDDVIGSHGISSGKISADKLFYLMSRGLSEKESQKLIVMANFNNILNEVNDEDLRLEIINKIEERLLDV